VGQEDNKRLIGPQIRAARALINWSAEDLSRLSAVSLRTIRRAEVTERQTAMTVANDLAVRRALESAGVEFTNGDQPGVRFNKAAISNSAKTGRRKAAKAAEKNK
jgi:hypothetical protein